MRTARILVLMVAFLASCQTPVPATVTWGPSTQMSEAPAVVLTADEQTPRVQQSLVDAGVRVVEGGSANYSLRVDVGGSRGGQPCGRSANVRYILSKQRARVLVIKGRGPTGSCDANIFDDMSRLLASYFGDGS